MSGLAKHTPSPELPPDHAYVPPSPGVFTICWHVVMHDRDGRDVHCNLSRAAHPLIEDEPQP